MVTKAIAEFQIGVPIEFAYRIRDINGNWLWFHDRSVGRQDLHDEVIIEGIASDITDLKRAEQTLVEREKEVSPLSKEILDDPMDLAMVKSINEIGH